MKQYFRPSTFEDCITIAPRIREIDRREIEAMSGHPPVMSLIRGLVSGTTCSTMITPDGVTAGMFGLVPVLPGVASVWALTTDDILPHRMAFLRSSLRWVAEVNRTYPTLFNYVHGDNTVSIEWLDWMGFAFVREVTMGDGGERFLEFARCPDV